MTRFHGNHPTIAVANIAGSAGKTTTVVSLATLLAEAGKRVLVVDLDGQANATKWFGVTDVAHTVADVILKRAPVEETLHSTNVAGVDLLPADDGLFAIDQQLAAHPSVGSEQRLRVALSRLSGHDAVLLDCPGSINAATYSALIAATHTLSVVLPTVKELEGVPALAQVIDDVVEAFGSGLTLSAVVPCAVPPANAGRAYAEAIDLLREECPDITTPSVRRTVRVSEAYARRIPLPMYSPKDGATQDYRAVLKWLVDRGVLA